MNYTPKAVHRNLITDKRIIRFGIVGLLNSGVTFISFYFMNSIAGIDYVTSSLFGYILGILNSYFWNKYWTFGKKGKSLSEFSKFVTVYIVSYCINLAVLALFVEYFLLSAALGEIAGICAAVAVSFLGQSRWSFK